MVASGGNDWQVYLLECADNTLYCGITLDLERRLGQHNSGKASKYTRSRRPVRVLAVRNDLTKNAALKLEMRIKRLPAGSKVCALTTGKFSDNDSG